MQLLCAQIFWFSTSISSTMLHPTLPVHSTRNYSQLFCYMLYILRQKDWGNSTGIKAAHRTWMKLTPGVDTGNGFDPLPPNRLRGKKVKAGIR